MNHNSFDEVAKLKRSPFFFTKRKRSLTKRSKFFTLFFSEQTSWTRAKESLFLISLSLTKIDALKFTQKYNHLSFMNQKFFTVRGKIILKNDQKIRGQYFQLAESSYTCLWSSQWVDFFALCKEKLFSCPFWDIHRCHYCNTDRIKGKKIKNQFQNRMDVFIIVFVLTGLLALTLMLVYLTFVLQKKPFQAFWNNRKEQKLILRNLHFPVLNSFW